MAKLSAGILSKTIGKVAGVVCSSWRGINYIREKVTPANPKSAAQTIQRNKFSNIVAIAQQLLNIVIHTFWDVLQTGKKLTGYNRFCQTNLNNMTGEFDPEKLIFSVGGLESLASPGAEWDPVTKIVSVDWESTIVTNGELTDDVFVFCYDKEKNFTFSQDSAVTRATEGVFVTIGYAADIADLRVVIFCNNDVISSLSQNTEVTAA